MRWRPKRPARTPDVLYRVFPLLPGAAPTEPGGALFVPRVLQGLGRHDGPDRYGALYASTVPGSAAAERIQAFRGRVLRDDHLRRPDGSRLALVRIDDGGLDGSIDLDEPRELARRRLRPSRVATGDRTVTQRVAVDLFEEGIPGFAWWSTIEASWSNVTLFAERAVPSLRVDGDPEPLTLRSPSVREAADAVGIRLAG